MPRTTTALQPTPESRHRLTWAVAALAGLLATPAAWAGFTVSTVHPWPVDSNYPLFLSGPFNLQPDAPVSGSGVNSQARYVETRNTQLPTMDGTLLILNESADSGWNTTTARGQVVTAIASLNVEPFSGNYPAQARTTLFKNHVYATSEPRCRSATAARSPTGASTTQPARCSRTAAASACPARSGTTPGPPASRKLQPWNWP